MPLTSKVKTEILDGAYAYISSPAPTICTLADTYYFVNGTFQNEILESWSVVPPLTYQGYDGVAHKFEVLLAASLTSDTLNNLVTIAIYKNGVLQTNSQTSVYIKTTSEEYGAACVDVIEFDVGDTVSIYLKASQAGSQITAQHMTTSLKRFF